MSTSVSRRLFFVKLKRKLTRPSKRVTVDNDDKWIAGDFGHADAVLPPTSATGKWWADWKTSIVTTGVLLAGGGGLYFLTQNMNYAATDTARPVATSSVAERPASSSREPNSLTAGSASGGSTGGASVVYSAPTDESFRATFDGRQHRILPEDLSGQCDIGANGIADLNRCLVRKSALAE